MTRSSILRTAIVAGILLATIAVAVAGLPVLSFLARAGLVVTLLGFLTWLGARAYQAFLWKVGRRLAFSYFLIGVVPIPLVILLAIGSVYVLASFFLGHLYRDALTSLKSGQVEVAETMLEGFAAHQEPGAASDKGFAFDYYRQGKWAGGAGVAPPEWPVWLTAAPAAEGGGSAQEVVYYVLRADREPTLAAAVEKGEFGVVVTYQDPLAAGLRRRTGTWVQLSWNGAEAVGPGTAGQAGDIEREEGKGLRKLPANPARSAFFKAQAKGDGWWDRPLIAWLQVSGPLYSLTGGEVVSRELEAVVQATPRLVSRQLFAGGSEFDTVLWAGLTFATFVLSTIYLFAVLVALYMIFGLSRAVNRLSAATSAVQAGDFSVRIPVRRTDQVGELQRSFNQMAGNLEGLIATAAQKEVLEKELEIAREIQESLLPTDLPQGDGVEFATLFEPSAAIGGDYFDILRLDDRRLAVVIADVSGHGLPSGLRMAMLKAALLILVEEGQEPESILERLDHMVRTQGGQRFFVTATLSLIDLEHGRLDLTNAGHPPTYLLRRGEVEEIALPGTPLGRLGRNYGKGSYPLEPDDLVVWLSDGFIEALSPGGEPFGYERLVAALSGPAASAVAVRHRLLAAVEAHAREVPADDDRTLVVMHYRAPADTGAGEAGAGEAAAGASPALAP